MAEAQDFDAMSEGDSSDEEDDMRDEGDDAMSTITVQEEDDGDMSEGSIDRPTEELPPEGSDDATNIAPPNEENEEDAHVYPTHLPITTMTREISTNCPSPVAGLLPTTIYNKRRQCFSHLTSNTAVSMSDYYSFPSKHFVWYQIQQMPHHTQK